MRFSLLASPGIVCKSNAVSGAGDDSARVAGSFAEDEEPLGVYAFESFVVARDAERRTSACFGGDNQAFVDESRNFAVKILEAFSETLANRLVHPIPQIAWRKPARVGGFGERFVFAVGEEVLDRLCGGGVNFSADVVGVGFDFSLQVETAKKRTA